MGQELIHHLSTVQELLADALNPKKAQDLVGLISRHKDERRRAAVNLLNDFPEHLEEARHRLIDCLSKDYDRDITSANREIGRLNDYELMAKLLDGVIPLGSSSTSVSEGMIEVLTEHTDHFVELRNTEIGPKILPSVATCVSDLDLLRKVAYGIADIDDATLSARALNKTFKINTIFDNRERHKVLIDAIEKSIDKYILLAQQSTMCSDVNYLLCYAAVYGKRDSANKVFKGALTIRDWDSKYYLLGYIAKYTPYRELKKRAKEEIPSFLQQ